MRVDAPCICTAGVLAVAARRGRGPPGADEVRAGSLDTFDRSVRPQDDLYRFANGQVARHRRHSGRPRHLGHVRRARRAAPNTTCAGIIEALDGRIGPEQQIRDLYASMTNEDRVEALGADADPRGARPHRCDRFPGPWRGRSASSRPSTPAAPSARQRRHRRQQPDRRCRNRRRRAARSCRSATTTCSTDAAMQLIRDQYTRLPHDHFPRSPAVRSGPAGVERCWPSRRMLAQAQQSHAESQIGGPGLPLNLPQAMRDMPGFDWQEWAKPQGFDLRPGSSSSSRRSSARFAAAVGTTPLDTWKDWLAARYITASSIFISSAVRRRTLRVLRTRAERPGSAPRAMEARRLDGQRLPRRRDGPALCERSTFPKASRQRVREDGRA